METWRCGDKDRTRQVRVPRRSLTALKQGSIMSWNIFRALGVSRNNSIHEEALLRLVKGSGSRSLLEYGYGSIIGEQALLESGLPGNVCGQV